MLDLFGARVYNGYMNKKVKFLFNIDEKVKEKLAIEAGYRKLSMGKTLNDILEYYLDQREKERLQVIKNMEESKDVSVLIDPFFENQK